MEEMGKGGARAAKANKTDAERIVEKTEKQPKIEGTNAEVKNGAARNDSPDPNWQQQIPGQVSGAG